MEEKKPKNDILNKIKDENIVPKSHFRVHWKNYVFWTVWSVIMIFGAISFSLLLLNILDIRPDFLRELGIGKYFRILMDTAPYLWIILVLIAFCTGYMAMRKTRRGYRYNMIFITTITVLIISMAGALLHVSKFNQRMGEKMMGNEGIRRMGFPAQERMVRPGEGMMGGVVQYFSDGEIVVQNIRGDEWKIFYDENTKIKLNSELVEGMLIAVTGEKIKKGVFRADAIFDVPDHMKFERSDKGERPGGPLAPRPPKE